MADDSDDHGQDDEEHDGAEDEARPSDAELQDWWYDEAMRHSMPDGVLALFVRDAEKHDLRLSLTLFVGGSVVSGLLINERRFFSGVGDGLASAAGDGGGYPKAFRDFAVESEAEAALRASEEDKILARTPLHIHLQDAFVVAGGQKWASPVGYWRGRITAVDGWNLGQLASQET